MSVETVVREYASSIQGVSRDATQAWGRLDSLTKPARSLGRLEEIAAQVARIQGVERPDVECRAIVVAAADHGVVAQGVSAYTQDVTWQMVMNFIAGGAAINQLAAAAQAELWLVDVGVAHDFENTHGIRHEKVRAGTGDITQGPAMTREECARAIQVGIGLAEESCREGVRMVGIGEMGIGNSTAAAALTAAYLDVDAQYVVGPGTGLDEAGLSLKRDVVRRALDANAAIRPDDPLGVLSALGGLEIACLAGIVLGCARRGAIAVSDGFIATAGALAASRLSPEVPTYLIASHRSSEPGHTIQLDALELRPVLELDMRLGEGTGAAVAFPVIDAACRMMSGMATFGEAGVTDRAGEA